MSEKPRKCLVIKGRYMRQMAIKSLLYLVGGVLLTLSLRLFYLTTIALVNHINGTERYNHFDFVVESTSSQWYRVLSALFTVFILGWMSLRTLNRGKAVEAVHPLDSQNAHLLPEVETLMRASDVPASQQTELLRAAQYGNETPPEHLLREAERDEPEV